MTVKLESARVARNAGVTRGIRLSGFTLGTIVTATPRYPFRVRLRGRQVRC